MSQPKENFANRVWKSLYAIDLKKLKVVRQKNGLDYIPWSNAWQIMMEQFPESTFEQHEVKYFTGKNNETTCEVSVTVTVREADNSLSRTMWLPVIDFKNSAVKFPDAYDINKARMRCLVKCLALFGLGVHLYTKDDSLEAKSLDLDEMEYIIKTAPTLEAAKEAARAEWGKASKTQRDVILMMLDKREAEENAAAQQQDGSPNDHAAS